MERVYSEITASISELKANPSLCAQVIALLPADIDNTCNCVQDVG